MLSKKYLFIKDCLTKVSRIDFLHKKLFVLSEMYMDIDKGFRFSYMPDQNGENEFIDTLSNRYQENIIYFDVGAHVGTYTDIIIDKFQNYQGHLFEPAKSTYKNCMKNHGKNKNLTINNVALSNEIGEVEYRIYPGDPTRNGIAGVSTEVYFESEIDKVQCLTGDSYCQEHNIERIDLLKIDAEGYDLHVIKGFDSLLTRKKIDVIQFEYNAKHSETHCMLGDFHRYLEDKGYAVGVMRQDGVKFNEFDFTMNNFESGPNYVACLPELQSLLSLMTPDRDSMFIRHDENLKNTLNVITTSDLKTSLTTLTIELFTAHYTKEQVDKILEALSLIGLKEEKRQQQSNITRLYFKRPEHYQYIEKKRDELGYWPKDSDAPRYSICISNFNMSDTLERAVRSVAEQLDPKLYEILVIDDGSNDGSINVLKALSERYANFRYIPLPRSSGRKLGETRNISIRAARGEYVLLHIDADDEWEPYLEDFVKLFHKVEEKIEHDFYFSGQQTGVGKREFFLKHGPFENIYRCEDRNLMMKLAQIKRLHFMDYRAFRTRLPRPPKKKLFKTIWDICSQLHYEMRQNEPHFTQIKTTLLAPITGGQFSLAARTLRALVILPIYLITRFSSPIINHITWEEMRRYHDSHRGTYAEIMTRLGGDPDISFLSEGAQYIFSHAIKKEGFKSSR